MKNQPKNIYLQVGNHTPDTDYNTLQGVTFHDSRLSKSDLKYTSHKHYMGIVVEVLERIVKEMKNAPVKDHLQIAEHHLHDIKIFNPQNQKSE